MTSWVDVWTAATVAAGCGFFLAGTVGLLRFPDTLTRLHALTKADSLGLGFIVLGLLPGAGGLLPMLKLLAVWALAQFAGASVTQLMASAAVRRGRARSA